MRHSCSRALAHTFVLCACVLAIPTAARAAVGVDLDCSLEAGPVDCRSVRSAYFESFGSAVSAVRGSGGHLLRLRATALSSRTRYVVVARAGAQALRLEEDVPAALDGGAALDRVVAVLQRATLPFVPLRGPVESSGGVLRLSTAGAPNRVADDGERHPYYVRPTLAGEAFEQGLSVVSLRSRLEASLSTPAFRLLGRGQATYRHLELDLPDNGSMDGSTWSAEASFVAARTIAGGWSAALLADGRHAPSDNLWASGSSALGVEWVRVPLRRQHESNVGLRYTIGALAQRYETPTVTGAEAAVLPRHELTAFALWSSGAVSLVASCSGSSILDRPEYWDVRGGLEASFPLSDALEVGLSGGVQVRQRAFHEPRDPDRLDPIALLADGSDFVPLSYGLELSLSYALGNALLHSQDQRWRTL